MKLAKLNHHTFLNHEQADPTKVLAQIEGKAADFITGWLAATFASDSLEVC